MALDLPAPIVELGEVLVQWGEHRHIVKLPIRQANELDEAMLAEDPNGDGLRGFIAGSSNRHAPHKCAEIVKKIFAASNVNLTDQALEELQDEYGVIGFKDLTVALVFPSLLGKKRLREIAEEAEKTKTAPTPTESPGAATTEQPLAS